MKKESVAVVIITNGPGELSTWVKPVVDHLYEIRKALKDKKSFDFSLRLVLVPCPNANGTEYEVAKSWNKFDIVTKTENFWKLLIQPFHLINWPRQGIVVFLGGDQFWSVLLARRLAYKNITYAEWIARWPRWNNIIVAKNKEVKKAIPKKYRYKCKVIGDLMADVAISENFALKLKGNNWIALLPGSKKAKLSIGIPYFLAMADSIAKLNKNTNLIIPIAPTTSLKEYLFFQSHRNPFSKYYSSKIKQVKTIKNSKFDYVIQTSNNTKIYLIEKHPCHEVLKECDLAITTVGANTAELAAITLPMIVVLPTQHINVMNAWDGIFGILGKISFMNKIFTFIIRNWYLKNKKFFAWPNIKAKKIIVPERIGNISPLEVAKEAIYLIKNKKYLKEQKNKLLKQRGEKGAAQKLAHIIVNQIKEIS